MAQAAEVIGAAERPVLYLGGGLNRAGVPTDRLAELIELIGAPFTTTLTALDVCPGDLLCDDFFVAADFASYSGDCVGD